MWLSPEGGQFSLWFKPGVEADLGRLVHPAGVQRRRRGKSSPRTGPFIRMSVPMELENTSGTKFEV